jgi:hypothetical protein
MEMISGIATINEFRLQCMLTHENLLEKNFILKIVRNDS